MSQVSLRLAVASRAKIRRPVTEDLGDELVISAIKVSISAEIAADFPSTGSIFGILASFCDLGVQTMHTIEGHFQLALYSSHTPANSRVLIEKTSASYASSALHPLFRAKS